MKKVFVISIIGVLMVIMISVLSIFFFAKIFIVSGGFSVFMSNPEESEITYGEFPFRITYELKGEVKVIEDVVICEYDGIEDLGTAGKKRKWKSYLESGNERVSLLKEDDSLEFYFNYGAPENYMGDNQSRRYGEGLYYDLSYIPFIKKDNGIQLEDSGMKSEEVWEKYGLRIIEWEYSMPIQNSFK